MDDEVITLDSEEEMLLPLEERLKRRRRNDNITSSQPSYTRQKSTSVHRVSSSDDSDSSLEVTLVSEHACSPLRVPQAEPTIDDDWSGNFFSKAFEMPDKSTKATAGSSNDQDDIPTSNQDTQLPKKNTRKRGPKASANSEERLKEMEKKKQAKLLEKALKNVEKEIKKSAKPEECLKSMQLCLDTGFADVLGFESVYDILLNSELPYIQQDNPVSLSVRWLRKIAEVDVVENQVIKREKDQLENSLLIYFPSLFFIDMVHAYTQKCKGKQFTEQTVVDYVKFVQDLHPQMKLTCVTVALEQHLGRKKDDCSSIPKSKCIFKKDVDEAVVALNFEVHATYYSLKDMQEFGHLLARLTKAVAEAPFKKEKLQQRHQAFSWYADADSSNPVKIEKGGIGLISLWQQQLTQFNNVGKETAQAIASKFPSPFLLMKAYAQCCSQKEAENLLKDIVVRRDYGPLSSTRKVGPELSYKIYRMFTSMNGNEILQR